MLFQRLFWLIIAFFLSTSYVYSAPICNIKKLSNYQMEYCLYKGKGPLLVLIGPQGYSMAAWPKLFLYQLNQFSSILIYNRIGYHNSYYYNINKQHTVTAKNVSEELHALLSNLKINKPIIIIAHSIGGVYAQYFIRNYPQHIVGAVMIDADSSFEPKINSPFQSKIPDKKDSIGYLESKGFNESMDQVNSSPPFPSIPLLVITATNHGSDKKIEKIWQQLQQNLAKQSPKGHQIIAKGRGHFVYQEDPAFVVQAIKHFIDENKLTDRY